MGKIGGAISAAQGLSSLFGGGGGGGGSGLTAEQQAALQFAGQQEGMKEQAFYADAGIPFSSGLAMDLGSIGVQTAAAGAGLENQNAQLALQQQSLNNQQNANLGNQLAGLGTALGGLTV